LLGLYRDYDVFAFPTWSREPFGVVALEAASAGCVPLITDECGIAEWLIDGVDCLKAPRSAEGFAERYGEILSGEVDLAAIGRRAQTVAWRDFHIAAAAERIERVLRAASSDRRPPRTDPQEFFALAEFSAGVIGALVTEAQH
jgi:glycosyltransferase involved in cell wall biosynthesis